MSKTETILKKDNIQSFIINNERNNNNIPNMSNQSELSQLFNNLYDSNFLIIINEVSSQIQSFYKSSTIQFSIIKSLLSQNENKDIPKISNIKNTFNNIELLFMQFYSTAKVLFKKMKIYRSEKIKNIRHYSLNNHKKPTITFNKDNKKICPLLNFENIKDNNNLNNIISGWDSARTQNNKKINLDNSNDSNINSNNNSNNFTQSCNTTIDKESNILLMEEKNQNSNPLNEHINDFNLEIKGLEEIILSLKYNNKEDENKIIDKINSIKKMNNSLKNNLSSFNVHENLDKKIIINNLANKINLLVEENNKIKKQFDKYKSEEKIKRKFFENQIFSLTNKNNEYEKNKKNKDNNFIELKNKYNDISNLYIEIKNINSNLNEELKKKNQKINELQNIIEEKNLINEYLVKLIKEHNLENNFLKEEDKNKIINILKGKDNQLKSLSIINNINISICQNNTNKNFNQKNYNNDNTKDNLIITPENYSIIKIYQYNNQLKWILFKKNRKHVINFKRYSFQSKKIVKNINDINPNKVLNYNYNDFIWVPYISEKDFSEFGDISLFIEKEKEYNSIIMKLNQKNKMYENDIEKLQNENYNLNSILVKYKSEIKDDKNLVGISFIDSELENSKFIDDKGCEEILSGLNKNKDYLHIKNINGENVFNINLKKDIDMLLQKIQPSENINYLLSSILAQLGCSDEDIFKLIGDCKDKI